jgi:hypothetical protein
VIWLALVAHAGSGFALLVTLSAQLRPALRATAHPGHTLALEPGLRMLLIAYASTPRLTAIPMAAVAWQRAGRAGRQRSEFRRWFGAGFVVLAAESVLRAWAALGVHDAMTPATWVARLRPPLPIVSAAVTMIVAGVCWALALRDARAAQRGSADGPDVWDTQDAAAAMCWTGAIAIAASHLVAPLAVAFVLRLG